jgi:hypothetical protein
LICSGTIIDIRIKSIFIKNIHFVISDCSPSHSSSVLDNRSNPLANSPCSTSFEHVSNMQVQASNDFEFAILP